MRYSSGLELNIDFGFFTPLEFCSMVAPLSLEAKFLRFESSFSAIRAGFSVIILVEGLK